MDLVCSLHHLVALPGSPHVLGCSSQKDGVSETAQGKLFGAAALPSGPGPRSAPPKGIFINGFSSGVTCALLPAAWARGQWRERRGASPAPPQRYLPALRA